MRRTYWYISENDLVLMSLNAGLDTVLPSTHFAYPRVHHCCHHLDPPIFTFLAVLNMEPDGEEWDVRRVYSLREIECGDERSGIPKGEKAIEMVLRVSLRPVKRIDDDEDDKEEEGKGKGKEKEVDERENWSRMENLTFRVVDKDSDSQATIVPSRADEDWLQPGGKRAVSREKRDKFEVPKG